MARRPALVAASCLLLLLIEPSSAISFADTPACADVDELPAYRNDPWASLYEVIAPFRDLCRVPVPTGYTARAVWPDCLWTVPKANIPKATLWEAGGIKADQSWLKIEGDQVVLPRNGGSMAASKLLKLLPNSLKMENIRTVLDEGAGVCGLGAEIMSSYPHNPVVLAYAPHDTHTNQVQLCLERGVPAIIFSMARYQFPVPPGSFDMVTCKWCWHWIGAASIGQWFLEVDRVLRPGGYFVMYASVWKNYNFKDQVEHWSSTLGWTRIKGGSNDLALYQKPLALPSAATPGFPPCPEWENRQPSFRRFHVPCRNVVPDRAAAAVDPAVQEEDRQLAKQLVALLPSVSSFTNILDANAGTGTFGQAMREAVPHAWSMNIQPVHSTEYHHVPPNETSGRLFGNYASMSNYMAASGEDGLPAVFQQGMVGIYHDWCFMFPGYPRIFDIIHARRIELAHANCIAGALLELDRLLRPGGLLIFSGKHGLITKVTEQTISSLGWKVVGPNIQSSEPTLIVQKLGGTFTR